jgi:hypothetical protein
MALSQNTRLARAAQSIRRGGRRREQREGGMGGTNRGGYCGGDYVIHWQETSGGQPICIALLFDARDRPRCEI